MVSKVRNKTYYENQVWILFELQILSSKSENLAFEEFLIDGDYAMNAGCWMWCSGSAFREKITTRTLDPVKFGRTWDPEGKYVRKYCPELKDIPLRYLFAPWTAPQTVQEIAKVN